MEEEKNTKEKKPLTDIQDTLTQEVQFTKEFGYSGVENPILHGAKFGRAYEINKKEIELNLFSKIEESNEMAISKGEDAPFVLSIGTTRESGVTLLSIKRVDHALREILYDQSYRSGNLEQNTGLAKDGVLVDCTKITPEKIGGHSYYAAEIVEKLSVIATKAFGKNTNDTRKQTENVLKALQEGITARNTFGDEKTRSMLWIKGVDYDSKTKSKTFDIVLHPLYAKDVKKNFALHRHGVLDMIGRPTDAKLDLLSLLGIQDKRKPFIRYIGTLLEELNLVEQYKKNKARTLNTIEEAIEAMVACSILLNAPVVEKNYRGDITKYTFTLNPNYGKG